MTNKEPLFTLNAEDADNLFGVLYDLGCETNGFQNLGFRPHYVLSAITRELDEFITETGYREPGYDG